ncbi:hypothetical protein FJR41_011205 [Dolichospermum planctonicum UHCC 0167]|jgi:hypothetical protein|uniref:hypothetical protein n=1 Tax=Dolichospermum planctonicum TaxID=136072 RepID=UPI0014435145|nr:hypothetical protein [Dolichospermum planctonicum]MCW9681357.1 hypothetical protein [Dolichospermum planctonicum UHCC 0167]
MRAGDNNLSSFFVAPSTLIVCSTKATRSAKNNARFTQLQRINISTNAIAVLERWIE